MKRALYASTIALLFLGILSCAGAAQDKIFKKDGSVLPKEGGRPVTVTKETFSEVEYKLRGLNNPLKIHAKDVDRIEYSRMPDAYRAGLQSLEDQDYEQAVVDMEEAIRRGKGFHWVEQNAFYRIALCYEKMGDYGKAISAYRTLLTNVPDTRFFGNAWVGVIQCTFHGQGKTGEKQILKAIQDFERSIKRNRLGKSWQYEADYWKLRFRDEKGEDISAEAEKLSQKAKDDNPGVASKAKILIGHNLLSKDPVEAKKYFVGVLKSASNAQFGVKAAAYTGLGLSIFKTSSEDNVRTFLKARDYFLRAITLGDKYPDLVEREVMVRALFYAARCFHILKREGGSHSIRYARDLFKEIIQKYPGTMWAKKAGDELKK